MGDLMLESTVMVNWFKIIYAQRKLATNLKVDNFIGLKEIDSLGLNCVHVESEKKIKNLNI